MKKFPFGPNCQRQLEYNLLRFISFNGDLIWAYRENRYSYLVRFANDPSQVYMPVKKGEAVSFGIMNRSTLDHGYCVNFGDRSLWNNASTDPSVCGPETMLHVKAGTAQIFKQYRDEKGERIQTYLRPELGKSMQLFGKVAIPNSQKSIVPYNTDDDRRRSPSTAVYVPTSKQYPSIVFMDVKDVEARLVQFPDDDLCPPLHWEPDNVLWWVDRKLRILDCEKF